MSLPIARIPEAQCEVSCSTNGRGEYVTITCVPGTRGRYDGPKLGFRTRVTVILGKGSLLILPPDDDDFVIERVDGNKSILDVHGARVRIERCSPEVRLARYGREALLVDERLEFKPNPVVPSAARESVPQSR